MNISTLYRFLLLWIFIILQNNSYAQSLPIASELFQKNWSAKWITFPNTEAKAYGIYNFRKEINITDIPDHLIIHVSADNRYILYVNGELIGRGPARSSLYNWNFETFDIASHLHKGKNVIASQVWNMGEHAPVAQISEQTGFLLQSDIDLFKNLNTNNTWKVYKNEAYSPTSIDAGGRLHSYVAVGAMDKIDGKLIPWNWEKPNFDDSSWERAAVISTPVVTWGVGTDNRWTLAPRMIPQMAETFQRIGKIRRSVGVKITDNFLKGNQPVTIPANSKVSILLDQNFETVGYPVLKVTGGKGSEIKITYAEALFDNNQQKGNRNNIEGKSIIGLYDIFLPDGNPDRSFTSLWVRTWRYIQLDIETTDDPLVIDDIYGIFSAYPFVQKASFASNDKTLENIWEVGWRTARLCAGETYFDCPYYEQLQYEGDTRIQALISMYNTGDVRLAKKALNDFYLSREPGGLTQGRFPSNRFQVIPTYSLFWISMMYDYWMHVPESDFLNQYLDAADLILKWYERHIDEATGMLGPMEWWSFTDYNDVFRNGVADGANDGHSSVITLQFAYTLNQAADLFDHFQRHADAEKYRSLADRLAKKTYDLCFNQQKMEMANQPDQKKYSQHAGIMAILANAVPADEVTLVMSNILNDESLGPITFYFRFYLTQALVKSGMADHYYESLQPWKDMLQLGLTTFAEKLEPTRSDCHAWSAAPNYDLLATICGIRPLKPGFGEILIQPSLGELKEVKASMPLPERSGMVKVDLKRDKSGGGISGAVELPLGMAGKFVWNGRQVSLRGGSQEVKL